MASHTERGMIVEIGPEERKSDKLKLRKLIIRTTDEYPQYLVLEAANAKCDLLKSLLVNEIVTVHFDIKGRPWVSPENVTKYFQSLSLWKIEVEDIKNPNEENDKKYEEEMFPKDSVKNNKQQIFPTEDLPW